MQKVLSNQLWKEVRAEARGAAERKAAIAYVTKDQLGLLKSDVLVTNASASAVQSGKTDARLLQTLLRRGVHLYDCSDLHAKVMLFGGKAVVGSCNMSNSSATALVEAAIITNHASTVAGVASFIEQLIEQSTRLTAHHIAELCKIEVIRRGRNPSHRKAQSKTTVRGLGNRTWIIGVRELAREPPEREQKMIYSAATGLDLPEETLEWVRWPNRGTFVRECREGDSLIEIWRSSKAKRPSSVCRATGVLLKQRAKTWTRFYLQSRGGKHTEMSWGRFQRMLKNLGYPKKLGPMVTHLLENEMADAIERNWNKSAL